MIGALMVIGLALAALIVFFVPTMGEKKSALRKLDKKAIARHWHKIEEQLEHNNNYGRQAVIQAEKLFDYVLRKQRFGGETINERIKNAELKFKNHEAIWQAHQLRDRIAKEANFILDKDQAKRALASFRTALKDLEAL